MATLVLAVAGKAIGGAVLGGIGATVGGAVGALAGQAIDGVLFGKSGGKRIEGPRLSDLEVQASSEGAPIPKVYGRVRLAGQIIWATPFEEEVTSESQGGGGKGGRSSGSQAQTVDTYSYYASFAIGLCEGEISRVSRIWADGKPLDMNAAQIRVHRGHDDQEPDSLIEALTGAGKAPAYRGLAYVVFERLPLEPYGNRIPQLSFEVSRAVAGVGRDLRGVTIIPGATEFGYDPLPVMAELGRGRFRTENVHTFTGESDWTASIDDLQAVCPNLDRAALVVSWFGTDLRANECQVRPGVEERDKTTRGAAWQVNGVARAAAHLVSRIDGRPAYGGTPSDASVIAAIRDLKDRGLAVTFYPFLMMDVASGNALTDPYSGNEGQPAHPWRGRITASRAPGVSGSPDKTATAAEQVGKFFGTAEPGDYVQGVDGVRYEGPEEWTWRRMILHYAHLCAAAGGVDAFLIGSELRGLTTLRDGPSRYPAVAELVRLAGDVKAIVGAGTKVSYAADWSEYFGHHPADGSGDVHFHLDPLWASASVDMVAIDNYMPLADWRDGPDHLDAGLAGTIHDTDYLRGNVAGGEGFDWFYDGAADRASQTRTPITDGAYGEPWVFRYKDLVNWWSRPHHDRPGGVPAGAATDWSPRSKPIWFTEIGCPAVDKGANQPNVFVDPKSSESLLPYFSNGGRDDLIQQRYLEALLSAYDPGHEKFDDALNPVSPVYGGRMVDHRTIFAWTWDARPYPAFPQATDIWGDGPNWQLGHWLTGRLGQLSADRLIAAILDDYGFDDAEMGPIDGMAEGYVIDRPMSARAAIEPLLLAFFAEASQSGDRLTFGPRARGVSAILDAQSLAVEDDAPDVAMTRAEEGDLPARVTLVYSDGRQDHRRAAVGAREPYARSLREARAELALVSDQERMQAAAEIWLKDLWVGRDSYGFALPPSARHLEPGDVVALDWDGRRILLQIQAIRDRGARAVEARRIEPGLFAPIPSPAREGTVDLPLVPAPPHVAILHLAQLRERDPDHAPYIAVFADPWPGPMGIWRRMADGGLTALGTIDRPAVLGETLDALPRGPVGVWDRASSLHVRLDGGALASAELAAVLGGANAAAVEVSPGRFEIVQFAQAELTAERTYVLSMLLRGQLGSDAEMADEIAAGAQFVLLDGAVRPLPMALSDLGTVQDFRIGGDAGPDAATDVSVELVGRGLMPWAPAQARAWLDGETLRMSWLRRSRSLGADNWNLAEVPEPEGATRYEIDILGGATLVARLSVAANAAAFAVADIRAALGPGPSLVTIRIHQISPALGRGFATEVATLV